jgi:mRNA-degrading endonuclease RelE of RelBE toxin-antitoxin system
VRFSYTERFRRSYDEAPGNVRRAFDKAVGLLAANLRHPSIRAKKYDEAQNIWQGRVNRAWRFYFKIDSDIYILLDIVKHPK